MTKPKPSRGVNLGRAVSPADKAFYDAQLSETGLTSVALFRRMCVAYQRQNRLPEPIQQTAAVPESEA